MAFNYIEEIKNTIAVLQFEGAISHAKKIQEAMDSAFTSTELLMGVKFYLSEISPSSVSKSTMDQIQALVKEIEKILNP